jgi:hypothetical protein
MAAMTPWCAGNTFTDVIAAAPGTYTMVIPAARQPFGRVLFANTDSTGPVSMTSGGIGASLRARLNR